MLFAASLFSPSNLLGQANTGSGFGTLGGIEPSGTYPPPQHYLGLRAYRDGDLETAIELFESALRGSRRDVNGRMLEAIAPLAMLAECHYQFGDLAAVRLHLDQAVQVAARSRGWLGRIDFSQAVQPGVQGVRQNLWPEAAAVDRIPTSDRLPLTSGTQLSAAVIARGGPIEERNIRTMDLIEIMRGLAVASYRRRVLLGPLADQDPGSVQTLESTKYPANLQSQIGRSLIGSMRTCGYFGNHDDKRALSEGAKHAMLSGKSHPLTAIAMLAQISASAGSEKPELVVPNAMRLVHIAAALDQPEIIGEAMQLAAGSANPQQAVVVRQMASRIAASLFRTSRLASLHSLVAGADASITSGDLGSAITLLEQAQALSARRDVVQPRIQAYGAYVTARLAAAQGASFGLAGNTELDKALTQVSAFAINHRFKRRLLISMPRIYQLGLISEAIVARPGGSNDKLLKEYCQDPPIEVWRRDAVDGLACSMFDRSLAHMARINLAASEGYGDKLLQTVDLMLGARFNQRLDLGGRVSQVRALARSSDSVLGKPMAEFRTKAGPMVKELRAGLQAGDAGTLAAIDSLEAKACAIALSRMHLPQVSPPRLDDTVPIAQLSKGTAMLTYTLVGKQLYATLSADGKTSAWNIKNSNRVQVEIGKLLKTIGVGKSRGNRLPEDDSWRETSASLSGMLFPDSSTVSADRFKELVVVPDGPLWYLPFELLSLDETGSELVGDRMTVRYAATPGLALKPVANPPTNRAIGFASSLFFAPRDPEINQAIADSIVDVLSDPVRIPESTDAPSALLGSKVGHLVVAAPNNLTAAKPFATVISSHDKKSPAGSLDAWMRFPAKVPGSVVLAGFRSSVDVGQMGTGDELFTTLCALNVAGVRSVMISRWAVGGESTAIVLRELLQELPFAGIDQSWKRARLMLGRSELDPTAEPLLTQSDHDTENLTGSEPLFWSGYMVSSLPKPETKP